MICRKCEEEKGIDDFYHSRKRVCKDCCRARLRDYARMRRKNPDYRAKQALYYREWYGKNGRNRNTHYQDVVILYRDNHPDRMEAMAQVQEAVRRGLLRRASKCLFCDRRTRTQGHHEDYSKPYEVLWVCASCHKKIHLGT